jgi:hypothetical protein
MDDLYLLDYGAGNVRSLVNAVHLLGYETKNIESPADFDRAKVVPCPSNYNNCLHYSITPRFSPARKYYFRVLAHLGLPWPG